MLGLMLIAIIYALFSYWTPYAFDDYVFMTVYREQNGGSETFSISALIDYAKTIRMVDNGRLANILSPISTLILPKWLFSTITGFMISGIFYMGVKLAGVDRRNRFLAVVIFWLLSLFCLPWRNSIMVPDYLLNYVFSSFFLLLLLCILVTIEQKPLSIAQLTVAFVNAFIAGMMHEGFSVPFFGGLCIYTLIRRFHLRWQWWVIVAAFFAAMVLVVIAPGTLLRLGHESETFSVAARLKSFFTVTPLAPVSIAICLGYILKKKSIQPLCHKLNSQPIIVAFATALLATAMAIIVKPTPRVGWIAELFFMIVLTHLFANGLNKLSKRRAIAIGGILNLVGAVFFAFVLNAAKKLDDQNTKILAEIDKSPNGTVFYDILPPDDFALPYLYLPMRYQYVETFQIKALRDYFQKSCAIVPTALRDVTFEKMRPIPGNSDLLIYNGELLSRDTVMVDPEASAEFRQYILQKGNASLKLKCFAINFKNEKGETMNYVRVLRGTETDGITSAVRIE